MPETDPTERDQADPDVVEDDGPGVEELDSDPAYNPQDEDLKDLKGG